ncbi:MAG: sugar ABC transporter permease [Thermomicrobiales bacterium]|nr:sugar ABC transporter permease [Thermomicrobiales bacterium]
MAMPSARVTETRRRRLRSRHLAGWLCLLPFLAVNFIVILGPSLSTFYYSLTDWNGIGPATYIGLQNFRDLTHDHNFVEAFRHVIIWTCFFLTVPIAMGLLGSFLLSQITRGQMLFRLLYFIPYTIASVVNASMWKNIFDTRRGIFAQLDNLGVPGMDNISIFGSTRNALWGVAWVDNWHWWGFLVVVFLAAMQSVDQELYDAVKLDGGGRWREFRDVTIPGILPTLVFILLLTIIASLLVFDYIYIITQGGPAGSTEMVGTLLYKTAFEMFEAGYAAAMGVTMTLLSVLIMLGYRTLQRRGWEV